MTVKERLEELGVHFVNTDEVTIEEHKQDIKDFLLYSKPNIIRYYKKRGFDKIEIRETYTDYVSIEPYTKFVMKCLNVSIYADWLNKKLVLFFIVNV